MNQMIMKALLEGRLILFLGAGASATSINKYGKPLLQSDDLSRRIADKVGWKYQGESLSTTYAAARRVLGIELDNLLSAEFQYCQPSEEFIRIAQYPWVRLYTTNIDDALEQSFSRSRVQNLQIRNRNDSIEDKDQLFRRLDLVHLNGSISNRDAGFIFSPEEYGKNAAEVPKWYSELAVDYFQCTFLFVGTRLTEPLFYHQVERYRQTASTGASGAPKSYVLTPSISEIEKAGLESINLEHISGTLKDFTNWLQETIPNPPTTLDIAYARIPELQSLMKLNRTIDQEKYIALLQNVTLVSHEALTRNQPKGSPSTVRNFYKGFKPTWRDIIDSVPAKLSQFDGYINRIKEWKSNERGIAIIGPAGSGKTTFLKMAALELYASGEIVYYIEKGSKDIVDLICELERANSKRKFYIFFDRLDFVRDDLKSLFSSGKIVNAMIVGGESRSVWKNRVEANLGGYFKLRLQMNEIEESDADILLEKIQKYGPWTRLAQLSEKRRRRELFEKSKRQLLIGLLETTTGLGFEQIIANDYASIASESDKIFFVMVCLCTMHRLSPPQSLLGRALNKLAIYQSPSTIADHLAGMVEEVGGTCSARHPVYARKILENIVDPAVNFRAVSALLDAFTVYPAPVVRHVDKSQAALFKALINHKFLLDIFRENMVNVLKLYARYEKTFEVDGLFWLQYGLATRAADYQQQAYERFLTAYEAYPHNHTIHALAQQELVIARDPLLSKPAALALIEKAIDRLKSLDAVLDSDDTYPIVTLSEGHVNALMVIEGEQAARIKAREYSDVLSRRLRDKSDQRLTDAYNKLFRYATVGVWKDDDEINQRND